ncbi:MAG: phospholipid carrier-dependent glycosyltransferase [Betaproteobacteria bacterium]|nr:MAG: phospholipid carrier-dependent glycosyltransferase [Betaproteobacteria bacterium]
MSFMPATRSSPLRRAASLWHVRPRVMAAALFAGLLLWLAAGIGLRPLALPDEGRYVGVAWEMLRDGQWLVPTLDGLPFLHKPPLFYWITSLGLTLFGPSPGAARLAPLLGALLAAASLYRVTARWSDVRHARLAVTVLATQALFFLGAQYANMDMLVAGLTTAAIAFAADALLSADAGRPHRATLLAAAVSAALAVLAKGLIGIVLPLLVIAGWLLATRRWRWARRLVWWPALLLFAAVALPWFIAVQWRVDGFLDYFIVRQHLQRYAGSGFNNVQPWWFYLAVLAVLTLPWSVTLWLAVRRRGPLHALMWAWVLGVLLFFSLPSSKLAGYILPALPPLAWLAADGLRGVSRARVGALVAMAVLMCGIGLGVAHRQNENRSTQALADVLLRERQPTEPLVFMGRYYYDLPLLARLREPVPVIDDWSDPAIARSDDWHRELADAARFAGPARAEATLLPPQVAQALGCGTWVLAPLKAPPPRAARLVAANAGDGLWRVDDCAAARGSSGP